jgi:DNA-binding transcriptional regulator GbsR (MarR family)
MFLLIIEELFMTSSELRKEFLMTIGKTYELYGYPEYCGWVEGLLVLEPGEWTQQGISFRLTELLPSTKPTSVPSINRALKILESYGIVEKTGSRKTGYLYSFVSSQNLVQSMLHQFITVNQNFITRMKDLAARTKKKDPKLLKAVNLEIKAISSWNRAVEMLLNLLDQ